MNNNNYITEEETVKIKISDYMILSQEDRQSHIDLLTECVFYYYTKDRGNKKIGDLYSNVASMSKAKEKLLDFHNIEDFNGHAIHTCHKCDNNSSSKTPCINILHLYFGSASENEMDKPDLPENIRKEIYEKSLGSMTKEKIKNTTSKAGKIGGKKRVENQLKNGTHISQTGKSGFHQKAECPHCNKLGGLGIMKRWHFDNCKFKP